jgi:hypothetical protein
MPLILLTALLLVGCAGMPAKTPFSASPSAPAASAAVAQNPNQSVDTTPIGQKMAATPSPDAVSPAGRGTVLVAGREIPVDVVDTPASRERGLSGRSSLAPDTGMLFVWDQAVPVKFWMPDMNFAIDIIFARAGKVTAIFADAQPCPSRDDCPTFGPDEPSDNVLEVPAGSAGRWGLKVGDPIALRR